MTEKKVLFISHDALRTGAPIIFLDFLKWFRHNTSIPFRIILRNGGELEPEFQSVCSVSVLNRRFFSGRGIAKKGIFASRLQAVANRIHLEKLRNHLTHDNIGLIYSNTITNGEVLQFLSCLNCPVITHVHELEYWINQTGSSNFMRVKKYTTHYIAVSEAVKNNLVQGHQIPENRIDVVHGFVPLQDKHFSDALQAKYQIKKKLNIEADAMIVGACGTTDWRKGPDLFVQLSRAVYDHGLKAPIHFIWVGGKTHGLPFYELWHDVKKLGLENHMHFVGKRANPLDYFAAFDVFALVSREDPFPLVCLEAASLGKPIVCFDGAGGMKEFVQEDCGYVVPYLDIEAMATKVLSLLTSPELRETFGKQAAQKVHDTYEISVGAPKLLEIIQRFL